MSYRPAGTQGSLEDFERRIKSAVYTPLAQLDVPPAGGPLPWVVSSPASEASSIVVASVKEGKGANGLIVRLYEVPGASTRTVLHCGLLFAAADATNLFGEHPIPVEIAGRNIPLDFGPFEIVTLRRRIDPSSRQGSGSADPRPT